MSKNYHINAISIIAKNELYALLRHPLVILLGVILLFFAFINGYGSSGMILQSYFRNGQDSFMQGYAQVYYHTVYISNIMAAFLGVISIAKERWSNSLNVLMTKPLFRTDVIIGKFIGISIFLSIFIGVVLIFTTGMLILFFEEPLLYARVFSRLIAYIFILAGECSLMAILSMLVGTVFNSFIGSIAVIITYIYIIWISSLTGYLDNFSFIIPNNLITKIINPAHTGYPELFNTLIPISKWFSDATPYIIFLLLYIVAVLFMNCWIFSKTDDLEG